MGAAIGVVLGVIYYAGASSDFRDHGGWGAFLSVSAGGGLLGAVAALSAVVGGVVALVAWDRRMLKSPRSRTRAVVVGAIAGVAVPWLALGVVNGVTSPIGWSWFGAMWLPIAVSAPIAGIAAEAIAARAERGAPATAARPAGAPCPSSVNPRAGTPGCAQSRRMTDHENNPFDAHERDTIDETLKSQTLDGESGLSVPDLDPRDYDQADVDQADVERSDSDIVAGQPDTASGFADEAAATQGLRTGGSADPVDDADPETTGAG